MKVSIITATFNSASTIADTLESVRIQTYPTIEHIIVDGLSTDNTLTIVNNAQRIEQVVSEKDKGIYDAMNKGIALTNGEIIGILNSDDFYAHEKVIEEVVALFEQTNCDAVYGNLIFVHPDNPKKILRKWIAGGYDLNLFLKGWMPPHPTFFVKKSIYDQLGNFNIALRSSADYELLLRFLYVNKIKVEYLHDVLVHMRSGGQSTKSFSNRIKAHKEDYMAWRLNGITPKWYTLMLKPVRKIKQFLFPRI
ncbi:MAG TPA: glycosyltransferase family 2 protein [Chitinophagaceae bacterium]|nr:glycosyltransferase family 2 protein [Chitinophagaceae bacterium]